MHSPPEMEPRPARIPRVWKGKGEGRSVPSTWARRRALRVDRKTMRAEGLPVRPSDEKGYLRPRLIEPLGSAGDSHKREKGGDLQPTEAVQRNAPPDPSGEVLMRAQPASSVPPPPSLDFFPMFPPFSNGQCRRQHTKHKKTSEQL